VAKLFLATIALKSPTKPQLFLVFISSVAKSIDKSVLTSFRTLLSYFS